MRNAIIFGIVIAVAVTLVVPDADAGSSRVPVIKKPSVTRYAYPGPSGANDTVFIPFRSFLVVMTTIDDSGIYFTHKGDTPEGGFPLLPNQYYPESSMFLPGDTIVLRCAGCPAGQTGSVKLKIYDTRDR